MGGVDVDLGIGVVGVDMHTVSVDGMYECGGVI